eukprot:Opistho-1_new@34545
MPISNARTGSHSSPAQRRRDALALAAALCRSFAFVSSGPPHLQSFSTQSDKWERAFSTSVALLSASASSKSVRARLNSNEAEWNARNARTNGCSVALGTARGSTGAGAGTCGASARAATTVAFALHSRCRIHALVREHLDHALRRQPRFLAVPQHDTQRLSHVAARVVLVAHFDVLPLLVEPPRVLNSPQNGPRKQPHRLQQRQTERIRVRPHAKLHLFAPLVRSVNLWRHVRQRPARATLRPIVTPLRHHRRQPKVRQLEIHVAVHEDVLGLDVAVHDAVPSAERERRYRVAQQERKVVAPIRPRALQQRIDPRRVPVLHAPLDQVPQAAIFAVLEDGVEGIAIVPCREAPHDAPVHELLVQTPPHVLCVDT